MGLMYGKDSKERMTLPPRKGWNEAESVHDIVMNVAQICEKCDKKSLKRLFQEFRRHQDKELSLGELLGLAAKLDLKEQLAHSWARVGPKLAQSRQTLVPK